MIINAEPVSAQTHEHDEAGSELGDDSAA